MPEIVAGDPWLTLLTEMTKLEMEHPGPAVLTQLQRIMLRLDAQLANNKKLSPEAREMMQIYRESLRVAGTVWQLQNEHALASVDFMLKHTLPPETVKDRNDDRDETNESSADSSAG